ncbi:MAG: MarR family transcriptional regulator [Flavobacteriales bacterium]|jgi:DNA-binding MarR family transcriptional regulator|nr:MarR family transcriptional regulator [Flavobacteriales bacterium]MBK6891761.1 MarR family transcriptional regulator [Flavobacteriales bacterium]MBK7247682.1 MarR family transcriptional regulator [Flavobacteriales bacterium]MBK9060485.1 MarR family transcriptional regulator [Flavobacteriales bacterium]MBK9597047.1 MarR family transcriptional regulator [Flavobacteriales bacterium]
MASIEKELRMDFKSEHQKLLLNLLFTSNWLKHHETERLKPYDLSPQQYNILRILRGAKGKEMCMHEVLERMLDRAPNATRLTDKLIAKGLVLRERCEKDRRVVHLLISEKGNALLAVIESATEELVAKVARRLSTAEAKAMNHGMDKLRP